jgi:voltage-gated potassium channel
VAVFAAVFVRQVRRIRAAAYPMLRAVEALVMVATLFVVVVASIHVAVASQDPQAYSEPLTRLDGIYFTVTVLATVGFGDITPVSEQARAFTTIQMVMGVALLGAGLRLLIAVAQAASKERKGSAVAAVEPDA